MNIIDNAEGLLICLYVAPPHGEGEYKNKIVQENFNALKDAGVDVVMGCNEAFSAPLDESECFKSLDMCAKTGLKYFVLDELNMEFISTECDTRRKIFKTLTDEEKKNLLDRYAASLEKYIRHEACAGVKFVDEFGWEQMEGIKYAKDYFEKKYPDKVFYVNFLGYNVSDAEYLYGFYGAQHAAEYRIPEMPQAQCNYETKISRYNIFANKALDTLGIKWFTQDSYCMEPIGEGAETAVDCINVCLYEMNSYLAMVKRKRGIKVGNYIQDGHWDKTVRRELTQAEFDLQVNICIAYGMDSVMIFTGCCPIEYYGLTGDSGLIDKKGELSPSYYYLKILKRQIRATDKYLHGATFTGILTKGEFKSLQPADLTGIKWNDAIFTGKLPAETLIESFDGILDVEATSQCVIGCFKRGKDRICYLVNNSIATAANYTVKLDKPREITVVADGATEVIFSDEIKIYGLPAGESTLFKY